MLYTDVGTLHNRTLSIVYNTAYCILYNTCLVQCKYDLERSIPQRMNPLHQPFRCLCTVRCTVYSAVLYTVQYDEHFSIQYNLQEAGKVELLREYVSYASKMEYAYTIKNSTAYSTVNIIVYSKVLRKEQHC